MILLSAHRDKVKTEYRFEYKNGKFTGLLDNAIGEYLISDLVISDTSMRKLEKRGDIGLFYGQGEEFSLMDDFPKLSKTDIVVVVDVASGDRYNGYDFSVENISGFTKEEIVEVKKNFEWEGFNVSVRKFDGTPDDEDEAWQWKELGYKALSFIVPIQDGSK